MTETATDQLSAIVDSSKGVLLIALGNPLYVRYALNLAASIKAKTPDIQIALVHDDSLSAIESKVTDLSKFFDHLIKAPKEIYTINGKPCYFKAKLFMYDLSPFDQTLFLDVDVIWSPINTIDKLFDELKDVEFTMISEGVIDWSTGKRDVNEKYTFWAPIEEIEKAWKQEEPFNTGKMYQFRSELIYFVKNTKNLDFFELAKLVFEEPRVKVMQIAECNSDEYAFNIASCLLAHYPHKDKFCPLYWHYMHEDRRMADHMVLKLHYGMSVGGNIIRSFAKDLYNRTARINGQLMSIKAPYQAVSKRDLLEERIRL
jgi:alpha-N-acetylglucosamine transferase